MMLYPIAYEKSVCHIRGTTYEMFMPEKYNLLREARLNLPCNTIQITLLYYYMQHLLTKLNSQDNKWALKTCLR